MTKNKNSDSDRRTKERKQLTAGIKVNFRLDIDAEITDISSDGLAVKFEPTNKLQLSGRKLMLHIDMNGRLVSMEGQVRRIREEDGVVFLGLEYDREQLSVFSND